MPRTLAVAAVQFEMHPVASFEEFAGQVREALDELGTGHQVILFPELLTSGLFTVTPGWEDDSASEYGRIADFAEEYRELFAAEAAERGCWILAGTTLVRTARGLENIAFLFGPDGQEHRHSKSHIFPGESVWHTVEGDDLDVIEIDGVTVGIAICYEVEIPEVTTILSRMGAEVLLVPSYTFTEAGYYRVRHCAAARAIEDQVYVVHCPVVGNLPAPLSSGFGAPSILSPCDLAFPANGVIAQGQFGQQSAVSAVLDLDLLHENRAHGAATTRRDRVRRSDMYARYAEFSH